MRVRFIHLAWGSARSFGQQLMRWLAFWRHTNVASAASLNSAATDSNGDDHGTMAPPDAPDESPTPERRNALRPVLRRFKLSTMPRPVRYGLYSLPVLLGIAYAAQLFWPRSVSFAYANNTCLSSPTLLPAIAKVEPGAQFSAHLRPSLTVAGKVLYSHTTCITAEAAPQPGSADAIRVQPVAITPFAKKIAVVPESAPQVMYNAAQDKPIATRGTIDLRLSKPDEIFEYQLEVNDRTADCTKSGQQLRCNTTPLELAQTSDYTFAVTRSFADKKTDGTALQLRLKTVEPVAVTDSSIKPDQKTYDKPAQVVLILNKPARSESIGLAQKQGETWQPINATVTYANNTVVVTWKDPLPRDAQYELNVKDLTAEDGGLLATPYTLHFSTSAGPKVADRNFGSSKQSTNPRLTLTFDSALAPKQDLTPFIKLVSGTGGPIAATVSKSGRTVTIQPTAALPRCYAFTVKVLDGIESDTGISGGSTASFGSRTLCQAVGSIGTSAQGRDMTSYTFGSGTTALLFVGATHGNEKSSAYILQNFIDYLEDHPDAIPADHKVVIVPKINPDGFAANSRVNANNVDLNRNFPASNWKSTVKLPDQTVLATGGGVTALSEPESSALAKYVQRNTFRMIISYHARASVVIPNDSGDSVAVARKYADQSPVGFLANSSSGSFFNYDTTGAFEDWVHDALGRPVMVVELADYGTYEFTAHRTAILNLLQL